MKVATDSVTWFKITCPYCGKPNWLYYGDPSDRCGNDLDGLICWSCKQSSFLCDDEDLQDPDGYFEDGLKEPK